MMSFIIDHFPGFSLSNQKIHGATDFIGSERKQKRDFAVGLLRVADRMEKGMG